MGGHSIDLEIMGNKDILSILGGDLTGILLVRSGRICTWQCAKQAIPGTFAILCPERLSGARSRTPSATSTSTSLAESAMCTPQQKNQPVASTSLHRQWNIQSLPTSAIKCSSGSPVSAVYHGRLFLADYTLRVMGSRLVDIWPALGIIFGLRSDCSISRLAVLHSLLRVLRLLDRYADQGLW